MLVLWPPPASLAFLRQHLVFRCPSPHSLPLFSFPVCSPPSCFSACFYLFNNSSCSCFCHLFLSLLLLSPAVLLFILQVFPLISDRSFFSIFFLSIRSFFISVHRPPQSFPLYLFNLNFLSPPLLPLRLIHLPLRVLLFYSFISLRPPPPPLPAAFSTATLWLFNYALISPGSGRTAPHWPWPTCSSRR